MEKLFKNKKKIYIGGGFTENQLLYLIPILSEYSKKKKIFHFIFEKHISPKVLANPVCKEMIKNAHYHVEKKNYFLFFFRILKYFPLLIFIFFNLKKINKKKFNYFENEVLHGIWDLSLRQMNDLQTKPSSIQILKSVIKNILEIDFAKNLIKNNIVTAFMGHNVYKFKSSIALFLENKIDVLYHYNCSFVRQTKKGRFYNIIEKKNFKQFDKIYSKDVLNYFNKRFKGRSNNRDIRLVNLNKNIKKNNKKLNVVFLHVLKDSPFGYIDNSRIFLDYFEWLEHTISIISKSNEYWILKIHPSCFKWGENTIVTVKKVIKNILKKNYIENIFLDYKGFTINQIIKKCNRIVTFNGTVHLEAVAFGKKPIVISHTTLDEINSNITFKPKNLKNYSDLLLNNKYNFCLKKKKDIFLAKKLIFIIENFLSFIHDLNSIHYFPKDKISIVNKDFKQISSKINGNLKFLKFLGKYLADGGVRTYSKKFFNF